MLYDNTNYVMISLIGFKYIQNNHKRERFGLKDNKQVQKAKLFCGLNKLRNQFVQFGISGISFFPFEFGICCRAKQFKSINSIHGKWEGRHKEFQYTLY